MILLVFIFFTFMYQSIQLILNHFLYNLDFYYFIVFLIVVIAMVGSAWQMPRP